MKITIYTAAIEQEDGDYVRFATLADAKAEAKAYAEMGGVGLDVEVTRDTTVDLPPRELAAPLLNRRGWCAESVVVASFKCRDSAQ